MSLIDRETDLITKIQNGIKATDADDVYSCGMRNGMRWCMSLIDDKEPLYENCPSAQPERPEQPESAREYCAECDHIEMCRWYPFEGCEFRSLPSAQPEDWMERNKERILRAGMEGREIEFRIGGRLFAIREKAQ